MGRIITPRRGKEFAKDYNAIRLEDSESVNQAKLESWIAKELGSELATLYPNREWGVTVDVLGGMAVIQCTDVSRFMGYHVGLNDTIEVLRQKMKRIGGEILERGNMTRGHTTEEKVEATPRTFKDEVKNLDNG